MNTTPYSVNYWGSHPDANNDDCYSGKDFATLEQAQAAFKVQTKDPDIAYIELDGPDIHEIRKNPNYRKRRDSRRQERLEHAMQEGMAFGCEGYNDAMGW